jgi:putative oxidoreductase
MNTWAPLPIRLAVGSVFAVKGWWVLFADLAQRSESFAQVGLPWPLVVAVLFGALEFFGGALTVLGLYVRSVAVLLLGVELAAIGPVHLARGFIAGSALNLLLIGGLVSLIFSGAGRLSLTK